MDHKTIDLFRNKSNDEILRIVTTERNTYHKTAIQIAESILIERGIEYDTPQESPTIQKNTEKPSWTVGPLIVGVLMVALAFVNLPSGTNPESALTVIITLNILVRLIVVSWSYSIAEKFNMKKTVWIILGIIFGGWSLIAINIAVWIITSDSDYEETSENLNEVEEVVVMDNCPACHFKLMPQDNVCPDCGLALKSISSL